MNQEQIREILDMPKVKFKYGEKLVTAHVDFDSHKMYFAGDDGELTGQSATIKDENEQKIKDMLNLAEKQLLEQEEQPKKGRFGSKKGKKGKNDEALQDEVFDEQELVPVEPTTAKAKDGNGVAITALVLSIVAILSIAVVFFVVPMLESNGVLPATQASPSPVVATTPTPTAKPKEVEKDPAMLQMTVIQCVESLMPGDTITSDVIAKVEISAENYNLISSTKPLLMWDAHEGLEGMTVNAYCRAGDFLSGDSVGSYSFNMTNPWAAAATDSTVVEVPAIACESGISVGSAVILEIKIGSAELGPGDEKSEQNVADGVVKISGTTQTGESSVTYRVSSRVCNITTVAETSLFDELAPYTEVPSYERVVFFPKIATQLEIKRDNFTAATICVPITEEQLSAIDNIENAKLSVSLRTVSGEVDAVAADIEAVYAAILAVLQPK